MRKINLLFIMVLFAFSSMAQDWTVYDADVFPSDFEPAFDSSNTAGTFSWELLDDPDDADNNLLEFESVDASGSAFFRNYFDEDNPPAGVTIVARGRLINDVERAFEIDVHLSPYRDQLRIQSDKIVLQRSDVEIGADELDGWDPTAWNTYRISLNAATGAVNVYLNEDPEPILSAEAGSSGDFYFRFGDGSSGSLYNSQVDYMAWDTGGAYSPAQSPLPVELGNWPGYQANSTPGDAGFGDSNTAIHESYEGDAVAGDIIADEQGIEEVDGVSAYRMEIANNPHQSFYWRMNDIGVTGDAMTVVLRARGIEGFDRVLDLDMDNGQYRERFVVNADSTIRFWYARDNDENLDGLKLPEDINIYDWNTYRLTKNGDQVALYINEDPTPIASGTTSTESGDDDHIRVGDGDSGLTTGFYLDWITWDVENAAAPVEVEAETENPEAHILFITDDNLDDEQIAFLRLQGYDVDRFWPGNLSQVSQDTIDILNAADLVIIGRSPSSGTWEAVEDKDAWNALTVPIISNNQYGSRSSRINWFNSTTAFHANEGPNPFNAYVELPDDPIFSTVDLTAEDSIDLFIPPHDFLTLGEGSNAEIIASHDSIVVIARFEAGTPFYEGTEDSPAGPRTYFGFGNDNTDVVNYFPLTENGKAVYLAEIQRMLGHSILAPAEEKGTIIFVHDAGNIDQSNNGSEPRDQPFIDKLFDEGYLVHERYESDFFVLSEDELTEYNEADLVIIGRSGNSGDFQNNNKQAWNRLSSPVMLMSPFAARSNRLDWFTSEDVSSDGLDNIPLDSVVQAKVLAPDDPAFEGVDVPEDGYIDWFTGPYRTLYLTEEAAGGSNADQLVVIDNNPAGANQEDNALLMARFDAGETFYEGTEAKGGGPRSYYGVGHDDTTYYNISEAAVDIWVNEVNHLVNLEYTPVDIPSANSALTDLTVDGVTIEGFNPLTTEYSIEIEEGATPEIGATAIDENAEVNIGEFSDGEVVVEVIAADGVSTMVYTLTVDQGDGPTGPNILFVGRATGGDGDGSDDDILRERFEEWGYRVTYIEGENYNENTSHEDVDLVYISETIDSDDAVGYASAGYPEVPLFLAEPYGVKEAALNLGADPTRVESVTDMQIQTADHPITQGVWEANEVITVVGTLPAGWTYYQYEMNGLNSDLQITALGEGVDMSGPSWLAIEPSGVLKERAVIMAFHEGVTAGGTEDYWTMVQQSVLWLLDSIDGGGGETSAALDAMLNVYPNPSNEVTSVEYQLEEEGNVTINLLNLNGQVVNVVDSGFKKAGKNISKFNASGLSPGMYILQIAGENMLKTSKIFINQ